MKHIQEKKSILRSSLLPAMIPQTLVLLCVTHCWGRALGYKYHVRCRNTESWHKRARVLPISHLVGSALFSVHLSPLGSSGGTLQEVGLKRGIQGRELQLWCSEHLLRTYKALGSILNTTQTRRGGRLKADSLRESLLSFLPCGS